MTTNREEAWRLLNEDGEKKKSEARRPLSEFVMDHGHGTAQRGRGRTFEMFRQGLIEPFMDNEERVPTRRMEAEVIENIEELVIGELTRYQIRYGRLPNILSLSRDAFVSLNFLHRGPQYGMTYRRNQPEYYGVNVYCNPEQRTLVMALGDGMQEATGGLYHEE